MIGALPTPASDALLDAAIEIAKSHRLPTLAEPQRLAPHLAALGEAYNDPALRGLGPGKHLAARLGFYFARDVPKVAGAAREAIALGRIALAKGAPLRVLDLGAGLGASHRGLARALDLAGQSGSIDVLALDADEAALDLARELGKRVPREGKVAIELRTAARPMDQVVSHAARARFDVILLGNVLTELDLDRAPDERVARHGALISGLLDNLLAKDGTLVIVEPALRPRSRHLQRVREALIAAGDAAIVAPCVHRGACPLLARDADWCHEDLEVDLPERLKPVAKAAGLRWQGLTFSYLIVGASGPTLGDLSRTGGRLERVVSAPLVSKGKRELVVCGDPLRDAPDPAYGPHGARVGRLDREASDANAPIEGAARGDLLRLAAALDDKGRVRAGDVVEAIAIEAIEALREAGSVG